MIMNVEHQCEVQFREVTKKKSKEKKLKTNKYECSIIQAYYISAVQILENNEKQRLRIDSAEKSTQT